MRTFFKKLGITMVPIMVALLVATIVRLVMDSAFKVMHPSIFSSEVYACCVSAMWYVILSSIAVCWVFVFLMAWRKKKLIAWHLADLVKKEDNSFEEQGDNDDDDRLPQQPSEDSLCVTISSQMQKWYRTTRIIYSAVIKNGVYGTVQLDMPTEDEKEFEPFWRDCDAFIYALSVDAIVRKHIVGTALLLAAENQAASCGCKTVALRWDDRESEPWVLDWYKRKGYEEIRVEGDGHCHFLVKQLASPSSSSSSSSEEEQPRNNE